MLDLLPVAATALLLVAYLAGLTRLHRRGDRWPLGRLLSMVAGATCLTVALVPPVATDDELFPVHVGQHLAVAMVAPALLALSAPVTLALRTLPRSSRGLLLRVLRSRLVAVVSAPLVVLLLDLGGLYAFYLTDGYAQAEHNDLLHAVVHLHMVVAGCLFSWVVVGVDPVRRRAAVPVRVATLVVAAAGHDVLAKLLYAHQLPAGAGTVAERHAGAQLMYYGGTVVDVALAIAVMAQWYAATGRRLDGESRRRAGPRAPLATSV